VESQIQGVRADNCAEVCAITASRLIAKGQAKPYRATGTAGYKACPKILVAPVSPKATENFIGDRHFDVVGCRPQIGFGNFAKENSLSGFVA
jgi:hypothetical protein